MMRTVALGFWCSLLGWVLASSRPARAHTDQPEPQPDRTAVFWPKEVQGIGRTEQKAKADALQEALKRLEALLPEMDPPFTRWTPDAEFVDRFLVLNPGYPGPDKQVEYAMEDGKAQMTLKTWILPLRPIPMETLRRLDQEGKVKFHVRERQIWALYFTATMLLACLATLGVLHIRRPSA